jgi:predicted SprT family Zn-dependent metalloprotease
VDTETARALARELMDRHGLDAWHFRFDHARRRLGCCHYDSRTISLSRHLVRLNPVDVVRDTILHEIAHAQTPGAKHGPAWRARAAALGAAPRACASADAVTLPPAPYALVCDACGARIARYRRPRRRYVCRRCWQRHVAGRGPRPAPLRVVQGQELRRTVSGTP